MKYIALFLFLLCDISLFAQDWKEEARQAIRDLRMANVSVSVKDTSGAFVSGATVKLKMRNHSFKWGSTVNISHISGLEQQGFGLESNHPYYTHLRHFNSLTPENAGKWKGWLNSSTRAKYLEAVDWMNSMGIRPRGHTTIWPSISRWNAVPDIVLNAEAIVENGFVVKSKNDVIRDIIKAHIEEQLPILAAHGVYELDLINELVHEGEIVKNLMGLPSSERPKEHAQWYKWAKAAAPELPLVANEYNLFQSGNDFHLSYVDYIQKMLTEGAPVDVVGLQGHFFQSIPSYDELKERLAEVAILNLPISITEFDMNQSSYEAMERVLYAVFSEPLVQGFNFWGAWDGRHWRGNSPMYEENWALKESGMAWFDLVKRKWWTDTVQVISEPVPFETKAFLGTYDLFVEYDGQVLSRSFMLGKEGMDLTITTDEPSFPIPTAELKIAGDKELVYFNEPIDLFILSADSIESVTFLDGDFIMAVVKQEPFSYSFMTDRAPMLHLSAEVVFKNGYQLSTPVKVVVVNTSNAMPLIQEVFPPSGSALLFQDTIDLYITASDPTNDPLEVSVFDAENHPVASSTISPFLIRLSDLSLGVNTIRIRVEDDKYGFDEMTYVLNLVEDNTQNLLISVPMAADDDIEEQVGNQSIDVTGDLDLGEKITGIRYAFAGIPIEAEIDSAFIQFTSQKGNQIGQTNLIIQAEKSVNAIAFSQAQGNLSQRNLTIAKIRWEPPAWNAVGDRGVNEKSPDIQPVLGELLSQSGWTDESPIHIIIGLEQSSSKRSAFSYDLSATDAPEIQIYYSLHLSSNKPPAPNGFSIVRTSDDSGIISWQAPALSDDVLGFKFFIEGQELPIVLKTMDYELTNLEQDTTYTVQAQTIGKFGVRSDLSAPFQFKLSDITLVNNSIKRDWLTIYPNPTHDFLHIETNGVKLRGLQIFNTLGTLIKDLHQQDFERVNVSDLSSGYYLLKFWGDHPNPQFIKLIKK